MDEELFKDLVASVVDMKRHARGKDAPEEITFLRSVPELY